MVSSLYSPGVGYNGQDAFKNSVVDGDGLALTASVFVDVVPVNNPPVASECEQKRCDASRVQC